MLDMEERLYSSKWDKQIFVFRFRTNFWVRPRKRSIIAPTRSRFRNRINRYFKSKRRKPRQKIDTRVGQMRP